jgi:hypothetical protein
LLEILSHISARQESFNGILVNLPKVRTIVLQVSQSKKSSKESYNFIVKEIVSHICPSSRTKFQLIHFTIWRIRHLELHLNCARNPCFTYVWDQKASITLNLSIFQNLTINCYNSQIWRIWHLERDLLSVQKLLSYVSATSPINNFLKF